MGMFCSIQNIKKIMNKFLFNWLGVCNDALIFTYLYFFQFEWFIQILNFADILINNFNFHMRIRFICFH
jgi:hypothetical protein